MPSEWLAVTGWAVLLFVLVSAAIFVGRLTARLFLRATVRRERR